MTTTPVAEADLGLRIPARVEELDAYMRAARCPEDLATALVINNERPGSDVRIGDDDLHTWGRVNQMIEGGEDMPFAFLSHCSIQIGVANCPDGIEVEISDLGTDHSPSFAAGKILRSNASEARMCPAGWAGYIQASEIHGPCDTDISFIIPRRALVSDSYEDAADAAKSFTRDGVFIAGEQALSRFLTVLAENEFAVGENQTEWPFRFQNSVALLVVSMIKEQGREWLPSRLDERQSQVREIIREEGIKAAGYLIAAGIGGEKPSFADTGAIARRLFACGLCQADKEDVAAEVERRIGDSKRFEGLKLLAALSEGDAGKYVQTGVDAFFREILAA